MTMNDPLLRTDSYAKIFLYNTHETVACVPRHTIRMRDKVRPDKLREAVEQALLRFPHMMLTAEPTETAFRYRRNVQPAVVLPFDGVSTRYTIGSKDRMIGNYMFTCDELGCTVVGFENHSGKTYLGDGVKPIGKVLAGFGNNGEDGFEGARYKNVFATYSHGCLLPKNPQIADFVLKTALERKYGAMELKPLDNTLESAAHDYMQKRLSEK